MALKAIAFRILVKPDSVGDKIISFGGQEVEIKKVDGHWVTPNGIEVDHLVDEKSEAGATVTGTIIDTFIDVGCPCRQCMRDEFL